MPRKTVTKRTRSPINGTKLFCPVCENSTTVYHFAWIAVSCQSCAESIEKSHWYLEAAKDFEYRKEYRRDENELGIL